MGEVVANVEELPKAIVRRVVKEKLSELSDDGDISVHKDALLAFSEGARIFIHYLSATANDICKDSKRQTINADDVLKALEEIEFPEFAGPLKASLEEFRKKNAGKKARAAKGKEISKKKKKVESPVDKGENPDDENKVSEDAEFRKKNTGKRARAAKGKEISKKKKKVEPPVDKGENQDDENKVSEDEDDTPDND